MEEAKPGGQSDTLRVTRDEPLSLSELWVRGVEVSIGSGEGDRSAKCKCMWRYSLYYVDWRIGV